MGKKNNYDDESLDVVGVVSSGHGDCELIVENNIGERYHIGGDLADSMIDMGAIKPIYDKDFQKDIEKAVYTPVKNFSEKDNLTITGYAGPEKGLYTELEVVDQSGDHYMIDHNEYKSLKRKGIITGIDIDESSLSDWM